jgi:putative acetyltransferase
VTARRPAAKGPAPKARAKAAPAKKRSLELTLASTPAELEEIRLLFVEYAQSLPVDLAYQGFDLEVSALPGSYAAPDGALLLAKVDGVSAGCVGLRRAPDAQGEVKRLYVKPEFRGLGVGRTLMETLLEAARTRGYQWVSLDTLPTMGEALRLYQALGFEEVEAYYPSPVRGTRYLRLQL